MQTFLPYPDFVQSARALDFRRLGKQRVKALQVMLALTGRSKGWTNHPAVRMWTGHLPSLLAYGLAVCEEWTDRGFRDTCAGKMADVLYGHSEIDPEPPAGLGRPDFHASHRSNLIRKDPGHYGRFGWTEPPDLPYVWPVV